MNDVVNVGNDKEVTILTLAETVIRLCGSSSTIEFLPPLKEGDMKRRLPDNTKMRDLLQRDLLPLEDGIRRLIDSGRFA